jgi:hypothetical protein
VKAIGALWRQSHWLIKWAFISMSILAIMVSAEKVGIWKPDLRPVAPPFDAKACRFALAERDYPTVSFDELADDIQFQYRQECSRKALEYQGYVN